MGATCDKQFENIPDTTEFENQQYLRQKQRISYSSIKQQHKTVKPNTSNISIGMIETKINSRIPQQNFNTSLSARNNPSSNGLAIMTAAGEVDKQQLHATRRPFQNSQSIQIPVFTAQQAIHMPKQTQQLTFQFYHSLALPQYSFHPIPSEYMKQYQNLLTCQQQERNGIKYIGEWKDNKTIQGNGIMQSNTSKYIGQFMNGLKHLHGRQIEAKQVYQGQFQFGRRKGEGILYTPNLQSKGYFDHTLRKGIINYNNGDIYEGQLLNELYHGQGSFYNSATKIKHTGTYKHGKLSGLGQITNQTTTIYEGQFMQGLKHGKGTYHYNNNEYYYGNFLRNQKHGNGQLVTNLAKYEGNFINGKMQGNILVTNNNGNKNYTMYKNGLPIDQEYSQFNPNIAEDGLTKQWREKLQTKTIEQEISDRELYNSSSFKLYGNYGLVYGPNSNKSVMPAKEQNTYMQKPYSLQKQMEVEEARSILSEVSEQVIYVPPPIAEPPSPPSIVYQPPQQPIVILPPTSQIRSTSQIPSSQIRTPPPATISSNLPDNRLYRPQNSNFENQLDNSIESTDINPKINQTFIPYQNYNPYTSNIQNRKQIEQRQIGEPIYNSKYDADIIYNRIPNESKIRSEFKKEGSYMSGEVYNTPMGSSKLKLQSRINEINFG